MNLKKKILAVTIIPVLVLGMVSIILTVTMVKSSVMERHRLLWRHMTKMREITL